MLIPAAHSVIVCPPCEPGVSVRVHTWIGGHMKFPEQSICNGCQREMEHVATIVPMGGSPGLVAFLCTQCGKSESVLVYPMSNAELAQHREYEHA
jgi:hypothetical protein